MESVQTGYLKVLDGRVEPETTLTTSIEVTGRRLQIYVSNDWKDYLDPSLPAEEQVQTAKDMRKYAQKMLKAYKRGDSSFRFGYNGRDTTNQLIPRVMPVLQDYN